MQALQGIEVNGGCFLGFSGKGMTGSFGHLRRVVSHAGWSKASGGACWKIHSSMLQAGHSCLLSGRFLQVSPAEILSNSLGLACFGLRVFL